jgi:hypothetical protein
MQTANLNAADRIGLDITYSNGVNEVHFMLYEPALCTTMI